MLLSTLLLTVSVEPEQAPEARSDRTHITTERFLGFFHLRRHIPAELKVDANALLDCELLGGPALFARDFTPAFA